MAIASRVMPASGPVSIRSSPIKRIDERRFAGRSGWPMMARLQRLYRRASSPLLGADMGLERLVEIVDPFAVLGRNRNRFAKAEPIGIENPGARRRCLPPCWQPTSRACRASQTRRRSAVDGRHAGARVDHEKDRSASSMAVSRLRAHARPRGCRARIVKPGRVEKRET